MSRPILKTLIFALCLTLGLGSAAMPASALETQDDYCQYFADDRKDICLSALSDLKQINQDKDSLLEAIGLAATTVEQQIPKFNALKEVPYAISLVTLGNPCGLKPVSDTDPWIRACGAWPAKRVLAIQLANITETDSDIIDEDPTYQTMISKTFKELIDLGKSDTKYTDDEDFRTGVDDAEQNYNIGVVLLGEAVLYFDDSADVESMSAEELIAAIKALPEYDAYHLELSLTDADALEDDLLAYFGGLYATYSNAKGLVIHPVDIITMDDMGKAYAGLVSAATMIDSDFKVDLSSLIVPESASAPAAPDTGANQDSELSATIVTVAVIGIAGVAAVCGAAFVAKRYLFSPLKRRK